MPTTTTKKKRPSSAGRAKPGPKGKKPLIRREIWAMVYLLLSFIAFLSFFNVTGFMIDWYKWLVNFLCGYGVHLMPFALLGSGLLLAFKRKGKARLRVGCLMALPLLSGVIRHLLYNMINYGEADKPFRLLIQNSVLPNTGGFISGLLSIFLKAAISQIGAVILCVLLFTAALAVSCAPSVVALWKYLRPLPEEDDPEQPEQRPRPRRVKEKKAKAPREPKAQPAKAVPLVDIPLDQQARILGKGATAPIPPLDFGSAPVIEPPAVPTPAEVLIGTGPIRPAPDQGGQQMFSSFGPTETKAETGELNPAAPPHGDGPLGPNEGYIFPSITLLEHSPPVTGNPQEEMRKYADNLVDTLNSFNIESEVIGITRGPTVTRYELQLRRGIKFAKVASLSDDIALALGATGVRISTIPDKNAVGIEVPNETQQLVTLRDLLETGQFKSSTSKLSFAVGKDISGGNVVGDIGKMPHMLIAGTTGSGKSVCINSILVSLLYKSSPDEVKLIMIDPKMIELGIYNGIPHLLIPVVTDPRKAAGALNWAVGEMMKRYRLFSDAGARDMESYNQIVARTGQGEALPHIVIVIDELADLMFVAANEVEESVARIAQMARAAGMHLVIATQRPSADVITGIMKANIPSRIAFAVASQIESRIILDSMGAEKLIGRGDMLYSPLGAGKPQRVQGCFVTTREVEAVISFIKQNGQADYSEEVLEHIETVSEGKGSGHGGLPGAPDQSDEDPLIMQAIEFVVDNGQASVSMLQRRFKLGYARAARLVDQMEERGIVGAFEGAKPRQVLITRDQWTEILLRRADMD